MDLLKAELAKKKQRTAQLVERAGGETRGRKFVRRGEVARLEKEERERQQADLIRSARIGFMLRVCKQTLKLAFPQRNAKNLCPPPPLRIRHNMLSTIFKLTPTTSSPVVLFMCT